MAAVLVTMAGFGQTDGDFVIYRGRFWANGWQFCDLQGIRRLIGDMISLGEWMEDVGGGGQKLWMEASHGDDASAIFRQ